MQVTKEYKRGGFFGNSQAKYADMEGAGRGINMAYANRGLLKTKGAALRREKRHLKKLERQGKLNEYGTQSADRLDYLRNVQKDRAKKGIAAGALAAGAAFGAPALAGAVKGAGGLSGLAGKILGKGAAKQLAPKMAKAISNPKVQQQILKQAPKAIGLLKKDAASVPGAQPGQRGLATPGGNVGEGLLPIENFDPAEENFDYAGESVDLGIQNFDPADENFDYAGESVDQGIQNFGPAEENFDDGSGFDLMGALQAFGQYAGKNGMRISKKGSKLSPEQQKMLMAMLGARLPR